MLLGRMADAWCRVLHCCAAGLLGATALLILLNVITRSLGSALFWVDELAVYCMIWSALLGAVTTVRRREAIALRLLPSLLGARWRRGLHYLADTAVLAFALVMVATCWLWFDLPLLISVGFDVDAFIRASYNFIYRDPTHTLGIGRIWPWLVMPIMALSLLLFSLANLLENRHL